MPFINAFNKLTAVKRFDIIQETIRIINANGFFIAELLRSQLKEGRDADDKPVFAEYGPFYADRTVFEKERHGVGLGKHTEWVTNYMTGAFYASLKVVTSGTTFDITSDVDYFPEILRRSGKRVMELSEKSLRRFEEEILIPQLQERFKEKENGL